MTNLEWLKTLSAEELADWFYDEWLHHLQYRWSSSRGGLIIWLKDRKTEPLKGSERLLKGKTEPQKWETPPKFEHKGIQTACVSVPMALIEDEPQTNADQHVQHVGSVESVEPTWTKEEHEAFYTFLWNVINPNEMQDYIEMFETKDEPQTEEWYTYQDEQEYNDRWQTERSE